MVRSIYLARLTLVVIALSSCANNSTLGYIDWKNGARRGVVQEVVDSSWSASRRPPCLEHKTADEYAALQLVEVRYRATKVIRSSIAASPYGIKLKKGDIVELYPADCHDGAFGLVSRVVAGSDAKQ